MGDGKCKNGRRHTLQEKYEKKNQKRLKVVEIKCYDKSKNKLLQKEKVAKIASNNSFHSFRTKSAES